MKKIYSLQTKLIALLVSFFVLFQTAVFAQTTVQIGNGTDVSTGANASIYAPICRLNTTSGNDVSRANILYSAAEMSTASIASGRAITKVAFFKVSNGATNAGFPFKIYMRNSATAAPLATTTTWADILGTHTIVYNNPSQTIASTSGWVEFTLDVPFVYTGQSLEIAFDSDMSAIVGNPTTDKLDWQYTSGFATSVIGNIGTTAVTTLNGTVANYKHRPNIQITHTGSCSGTPIPGAATKSVNAAVCPGSPVGLNLTGNVPSLGLSYIWQSSSTLAGTYTNIGSSSSSAAFTINPTVTTFYRAAVTCGASTEYSTPVEVLVTQPMIGSYSINAVQPASSTNFQSFAAAISSLNCGIAGPVVFNVAAGIYTEQVILNQISGVSATNTITFNGNGSTLTFPATLTGERATVKLNGADHVRFDNFIITATGTTYGYGVHMLNNADSNIISNCTINVSTSSTSANYCGIVVNNAADVALTLGNSNCDSLSIINNTINGGAYGIIVVADGPTNYNYNNNISGNTVKEFYNYGIYVNGGYNALVEGNDISRPTRTNPTVFYGIYFNNPSLNCKVSKNKIHSTFDGNPTSTSSNSGLYFNNCDATAGNENIVSNNILYHFTGVGIQYGLYNSSSDYVKYYHNSVSFENESPSGTTAPTRGFYQTGAATGIEFRNNIINVTRIGSTERWGLYFGTAGSGIVSNNNAVYVSAVPGSYFGYYNSVNQSTIADWRTASGQDASSKSFDPMFINGTGGDLKPTANILNDMGVPVGITTDILNIARNATPDAGAYEFESGPCTSPPIPGTAIFSGPSPVCPSSTVILDLENNSIGLGQTYKWQSSATIAGTYTDISPASAGTSVAINPIADFYYRAAVTCGANTLYSTPVLVTVQPAFTGGNYTINGSIATGGNNFQTFGAAVAAIACGVTSSTVFTVEPNSGPYNEQVILPAIPGLSSSRTIKFLGNGNTINYTSSNTGERATVKLNGTDYITLDSLVINANGSAITEYGFGIQLINGADHNTITKCTVNATVTPVTAASSNFAGIVLSGSPTSATGVAADCDSNLISRNTVNGGYYGITMIGNAGALLQGNTVTNNIVTDFYTYGIYISSTNNTLVEKNDISRPTRSSVTSFNGIYLSTSSTNAKISKNRIHDPYAAVVTSTTVTNGVSLSSCDATLGNENIVSNNLVYNCKSNGAINAFNHSGSDYVKYYHNTVSLDDQASTVSSSSSTSGLSSSSDDIGVEFKNNIITITRSGSSIRRGYTLSMSSAVNFQCDYNVLYVNGTGGTNSIGLFNSIEYATLTSWKTANSNAYDQHSKSIDPVYANASSGDYAPTEQTINGIGLNLGFTTDINDVARVVAAPDPGAVEFGNNACTTPPNAGTATVNVTAAVCPGTPILLNLINNTTGVGQTYQWQSSATIAGTYTNVSGLLYTTDFNTTAPVAAVYYRCAVTCGGNTQYSVPVQVDVPLPFSGTYTINSGVATGGGNFQTFADAYNAMKCTIGGPVVFNVVAGTGPYNEQLIIPQITGMSATNTVTINGNGATISFTSTNTNERAVIKLDGADYVTINNLVIQAAGTTSSQYGYGVQLLNNADNNTINNCTISTNTTLTSTNYSGIIVNSAATGTATTKGNSQCDNNTFSNNIITGGYAGISLIANSATYQIAGNKITNNVVSDFYTYGIYIDGNNGTLIEGNEVHRLSRGASITTFYGINLSDSSVNIKVSKNKIHDPFATTVSSTAAVYGIRLADCDASSGNDNIISNNVMYNFANAGTQNAILNNGSDYSKYYHNTISLDDVTASCTSCATRGLYVQNATTLGIDFRNNIITISRGGTGEREALYFVPTSVAAYTINNNVYYLVSSATINEVAHVGTASYVALADWQAIGKDVNGASADPQYTSVSSGDLKPLATAIDNKGTPVGITTDILGMGRGTVSPDAGAYEFGTVVPITLLSFKGEKQGAINKLEWTTSTEINNAGFELQRSADGTSFSQLAYMASKAVNGNSNNQLTYSINDVRPLLGNGYYRLKQVDKDGKSSYSSVVLLKGSKPTSLTISSVYPNPSVKELNMVLLSPIADDVKIVVTDITGKVLLQKAVIVSQGDNKVQLNVQSLSQGTYIVKAVCSNGCETAVHRFVKQ